MGKALSEREKRFIVTRLAEYRTPAQVVADVRERFGTTVTAERVRYYDPQSRQSHALSSELRVLYHRERERARRERDEAATRTLGSVLDTTPAATAEARRIIEAAHHALGAILEGWPAPAAHDPGETRGER